MKRDDKKIKIYYLFFLKISIKEKEYQDLNVTFYQSNHSISLDDEELLNEIPNAPRTVIDKIFSTTIKQKILLSNKLSYYVLNKFFNIKVTLNKDIINDEITELLEDDDIKKVKEKLYKLQIIIIKLT